MSHTVECYSGSRYAERPIAVWLDGKRLVVEQVVHAWRTPVGPGFEVVTAGGRRLRLELDEHSDTWSVAEAPATVAS